MKSAPHCVSDIRSGGAALLNDACGALCPKGNAAGVFNSLPWERHEVIQTQDGAGKPTLGTFNPFFNGILCCCLLTYSITLKLFPSEINKVFFNLMLCCICGTAALVRVPSVGLSPVKETQPATPVSVTVQVCIT